MHKKKDGNGWLSEEHQKYSEEKGWNYEWKETATPSQHKRFVEFFHRLPLALQRTNDKNFPLRVVHAYWNQKVLEQISIAQNIGEDCLELEKQLTASITVEEKREIKTFYAKHDISSKDPPCAPTPGHSNQVSGASWRISATTSLWVAPTTKPS